MTLSEPIRRTLRHSFLAFAAGYCAVFVACQEANVETCPSGLFCPAGSHCAARQDVCIFTPCGNGKLDSGEVCDDGTLLDGDGCNSTCRSNETCGNGIIDRIVGEVCDDPTGATSCSDDCKSNLQCGNDKVDRDEQCDPGSPGTTTATCNANCTASRHGDGWVNPLDSERCDGDGLGNITTTATYGLACEFAGTVAGVYRVCNGNCTMGSHGDGKVNISDGELCDGTNGVNCQSPTCNASCTFSVCGDGIYNTVDPREQCDDGNRSDTDDCKNDCTENFCGDGYRNISGPGHFEACDLGTLNTNSTSCPYGQSTCTLCSTNCTVHTGVGPYCGDYHLNGPERCDNLRSFNCGTCDATSCTTVATADPTGFITVASVLGIGDGDTIVLDDGVGHTGTLEFDLDGFCQSTIHACVDVQGVSSTDTTTVAARVRDAINYRLATVKISAALVSAGSSTVALTNSVAGIKGNVPLQVTLAHPSSTAIVAGGMSGGVGCTTGDQCSSDHDCVRTRCGTHSHQCL